jgi:spore germination cell wall hydrolase CwlJ-like protein
MLNRESALTSPKPSPYGSWHGRPSRPCSSWWASSLFSVCSDPAN